ncbi:MAG: hypothetical protein ABJK20_16685 [Halieaceae bacterium]
MLIFILTLAYPNSAKADTNSSGPDIRVLGEKLTGEEIQQAFANVRDDARVQDDAKTRAVNQWHSDGRFISRWKNDSDAGEVTGNWRVSNDMRCVTISKGVPQRIGKESCGVIFRRGDEYLSFNGDGSIHGIHTLTPLSN